MQQSKKKKQNLCLIIDYKNMRAKNSRKSDGKLLKVLSNFNKHAKCKLNT